MARYPCNFNWRIAQSVERDAVNVVVAGSNPALPANFDVGDSSMVRAEDCESSYPGSNPGRPTNSWEALEVV